MTRPPVIRSGRSRPDRERDMVVTPLRPSGGGARAECEKREPLRRSGRIMAKFQSNDLVEVKFDEDRFRGAWYPAVIVRVIKSNFQVSYDHPIRDDSSLPPSIISRSNIRPRPLQREVSTPFICDELIDVFMDSAWLLGVVNINNGDDMLKYNISLVIYRLEIEIDSSMIRPHLEWNGIEFLPPSTECAMYKEGQQVEVSGDIDDSKIYGTIWYEGTVQKVLNKVTFKVLYKKVNKNGTLEFQEVLDVQHLRPVRRPLHRNTFKLLERVEVKNLGGWMEGVISATSGDSKYLVKLTFGNEDLIEVDHSSLRKLRVWINGKLKYISKVNENRSVKRKMAERPSCLPQVEPLYPIEEQEQGESSYQFDDAHQSYVTGVIPSTELAAIDAERVPTVLQSVSGSNKKHTTEEGTRSQTQLEALQHTEDHETLTQSYIADVETLARDNPRFKIYKGILDNEEEMERLEELLSSRKKRIHELEISKHSICMRIEKEEKDLAILCMAKDSLIVEKKETQILITRLEGEVQEGIRDYYVAARIGGIDRDRELSRE